MNDLDILQDQLNTTDESQDISQLALSDGYGYGYGYGYNEEDTIYVYEGYLIQTRDQFGEFGEFSELPGNIESYTELEDGTQITYSNPVFFYGGVTYIFVSTARGVVWDLNSSDLKWGACDNALFMGCRNKENGSSIEIPTSGTPVYYVDGYGLATDASSPFTWSILGIDYQPQDINISYTYNLQVYQSYPKNSYFRPLYIKDESTSIESIMDDESTYFTTNEIFGNRFYGHIVAKESYSNSSEITSLVNQVVEESLNSNSSWDYSFKTHLVSPSTPVVLSYFNSEDKQFLTYYARYQKYPTPIHYNSDYYSNNQWNRTNLRKLIPVLPQYDSYEAWDHYPIIKADYFGNRKNYSISTYKYDLYYIKVLITKGGQLLSSSEAQNYYITNSDNKYKFVEDSLGESLIYDGDTANVSPNITLHSSISGDSSSNYTSSGMYFGLLTPETTDTAKTISIGLCDSQNNQVVAEQSYSILKTKDQFNMAYIVLDIPENKSVFVGDTPVYNCFVGDIPVQKIYVGDTQVWARS